MQSRNKILDDVSQLMTNAMGVAQGAREEAETAVKSIIDRWLADHDFVTREEFDAVKAMAQKAREEQDEIYERLERIETVLSSKSSGKARSAGSRSKTTKPASRSKKN